MKKVKAGKWAIVAVTGALILSACSSGASTESGSSSAAAEAPAAPFKISFSIYTEAAPLFQVIHKNLDTQIASNDTGVNVKWYDNAGDPAKMLENVQLQIADKPDAIVIYPVSTATSGVGQLLKESGIPCVALNLDVA